MCHSLQENCHLPSINLQLTIYGPIIEIVVGTSQPRQEALIAAGQVIPPSKIGKFLIDTGASCTCIDIDLMESLEIPPSGSTTIQTPSTNGGLHTCNLYDVMLFIPNFGNGGYRIEALPIVETHLSSQGINGLLGRDVLDKCALNYNGSAQMYTLSY